MENPENCIACGHCVAVCPSGAMKHSLLGNLHFEKIPEETIDPESLGLFLASKRSIRQYTDRPIEDKKLEAILKAGACSPQAKNDRDQHFRLVTDPEKIAEMEKAVIRSYRKLLYLLCSPIRMLIGCIKPSFGAMLKKNLPSLRRLVGKADEGLHPVFHSAPCVITIDGKKSNPLARDDASIAMQYMMLQAHAEGIGSCLIGYASTRPGSLRKVLDVPKGRSIQVVATFGYPAIRYRAAIWREVPETKRYEEFREH